MRPLLLILLVSVGCTGPGFSLAAAPRFISVPLPAARTLRADPGKPDRTGSLEDEILKLVNEHRASLGLAALTPEDNESRLAQKHSENMASGKVGFGHSGFNARARAIQKAIRSVTSVAENVAEGQMNAREVVDGWLHSPGHKKNIEGNFTLTGIGSARDKKGNTYFTQLFSR